MSIHLRVEQSNINNKGAVNQPLSFVVVRSGL